MLIVGQMALGGILNSSYASRFPLWRECLENLLLYCDEVYLRVDVNTSDFTYEELEDVCKDKLKDVLFSDTKWNRWNWREEMLRMLDNVNPDVVLTLDQDEQFEDTLLRDIRRLVKHPNKKALMFSYYDPMPTEDNVKTLVYPHVPHMKAYKWQKGLTYRRYRYSAKVTNYKLGRYWLMAYSKIRHYCFYTKALRLGKKACVLGKL